MEGVVGLIDSSGLESFPNDFRAYFSFFHKSTCLIAY